MKSNKKQSKINNSPNRHPNTHLLNKTNFNKVLEKSGMTQKELAKKLNVSPQEISNYLSDPSKSHHRNIRQNELEIMAKVLNTTTEYLLGELEHDDSDLDTAKSKDFFADRYKKNSSIISILSEQGIHIISQNNRYYMSYGGNEPKPIDIFMFEYMVDTLRQNIEIMFKTYYSSFHCDLYRDIDPDKIITDRAYFEALNKLIQESNNRNEK